MRKQVIADVKHISATNSPGPLGVDLNWVRKDDINAFSHGNNTYTIHDKMTRSFSRGTVGCVMGHEVAHDRHLDGLGTRAARAAMGRVAPASPLLKAETEAARKRVLAKLSVIAEAQAS